MSIDNRISRVVVATSLLLAACQAAKGSQEVDASSTPTPATAPVGPDFQATIDALKAQLTAQVEMPTATSTIVPTATLERIAMQENVQVSDWDVEIYGGATKQMRDWVGGLKNLDPVKWPEFPNVDNPQVNFSSANGLEYGMDESVFCQQDQTCDIPVPARHYRIITADYDIPGIDACTGSETNLGCGIMLINVGEVTANFRDAKVDTGFTVFGRYWNGDKLPEAIFGGLSHVANNMLNLNSTLNPDKSVNAGANCSVPGGCESVRLVFAIISGNELLVKGVTTVNR